MRLPAIFRLSWPLFSLLDIILFREVLIILTKHICNVYWFILQVKVWDDRKLAPLSILKPHDGQAVYSVAFLTAPERPHHINLITAVCTLAQIT